jgi:hypothetical protein
MVKNYNKKWINLRKICSNLSKRTSNLKKLYTILIKNWIKASKLVSGNKIKLNSYQIKLSKTKRL